MTLGGLSAPASASPCVALEPPIAGAPSAIEDLAAISGLDGMGELTQIPGAHDQAGARIDEILHPCVFAHDQRHAARGRLGGGGGEPVLIGGMNVQDRKSTRLNSSHLALSY